MKVNDNTVDGSIKLHINRTMIEESPGQSEKGQYKAPFGYGPSAGFWETNPGLDNQDLFGEVYRGGLYAQARYAHDIIASVYDYRKAAVEGLEYKVVPRAKNPTASQRLAAEAVNMMLSNQAGRNLNTWIADTYDKVNTFGHVLYEIFIPKEGPDAHKLHLELIPAQQIEWFNYRPDNRDAILNVEVTSGDNIYMIEGAKLAWFGNKAISGNFWGISDLRKILALFLAYQEDLKNYLALRRLEKGILYFQETDQGSTTENWQIAKAFMLQYFNGKSSPLINPRGMTLNHLNAGSPSLASYNTMLEYFDTKIKQALDSSLNNLGLNGVGSHALGKEVAIADREKFVAHVDQFINKINNPDSPGTDLLRKLTGILGFDPDTDTPEIQVVNNVAVRLVDQADLLIKLLDKEIITPDLISLETKKQLLVELGVSTTEIDKKIALEGQSSLAQVVVGTSSMEEDPIDMTPTKEMMEAAKRGLEIRESLPPSKRGGTAVGVARARDIKNGRRLSLETWKRIYSFASRHLPDYNEQKAKLSDVDFRESKSYQAMLLWGGEGALKTAERIIAAHEGE